MRKVLALGATIVLVGSVGVATAQERLQQSAGGSAMGVGTGVGDVSGSANRVQAFDRSAFLDRLSLPETIYGRVLAIDTPAGKMHLETGGSSHDEGRAGMGSMNSLVVFFDDRTNMDQIKTLNTGDDISLQVIEATSGSQEYGTGRKIVREVYLLRGNEKLAGFGGLGQRPNPSTERAIETNNNSVTGGIPGSVFPGKLDSGITSPIGEYTGSAPCWQCEPQPGWGNNVGTKSDYGTDRDKPNLVKGLN